MSRARRLMVLTIVVSGLLVLPRVLMAPARGQSGCSPATLTGPYGIEGSGFIFGSPSAFVGTWTFDGQGKSLGSFILNLGGNLDRIDYTGTYTLNSGCAGTMSILTPHHTPPVPQHYHDIEIVVVDGGKEVFFNASGPKGNPSDTPPPGETVSGVMKRL